MNTLYLLIIILSICLIGTSVNEIPLLTHKAAAVLSDTTYLNSPLKQFKSGTAAKDVICKEDLHLVIKAEDGSPACVKPEDVTKLFERGWTNLVHYYVDPYVKPKIELYDYFYEGIDKDNATVSINNQTYYQTTLNYNYNLKNGTQIQFQNVTFTFPEGIMATPGGAFIMLDVQFRDGYEEIYGGKILSQDGSSIIISGIETPTQFGPHLATNSTIVLGNHMIPQAGLAMYHDKIKLLVSAHSQSIR